MNTTVVCREVRPADENSKHYVVIASQDEQAGGRTIDFMDPSDLAEVSDRLRAQGIVLGGALRPAQSPSARSGLVPPVKIIAQDEHDNEHQLIADQLEEYHLSSGSTLYILYVPEAPCDCRWLVGRTLEVAELGNHPSDLVEPSAAACRPHD